MPVSLFFESTQQVMSELYKAYNARYSSSDGGREELEFISGRVPDMGPPSAGAGIRREDDVFGLLRRFG